MKEKKNKNNTDFLRKRCSFVCIHLLLLVWFSGNLYSFYLLNFSLIAFSLLFLLSCAFSLCRVCLSERERSRWLHFATADKVLSEWMNESCNIAPSIISEHCDRWSEVGALFCGDNFDIDIITRRTTVRADLMRTVNNLLQLRLVDARCFGG